MKKYVKSDTNVKFDKVTFASDLATSFYSILNEYYLDIHELNPELQNEIDNICYSAANNICNLLKSK